MGSSTVAASRGKRPRRDGAAPQQPRRGGIAAVVRAVGWTLIATGSVILLYLVHLLFLTGLTTQRAQEQMLQQFDVAPVSAVAAPTPDATAPGRDATPSAGGDAPAVAPDPGPPPQPADSPVEVGDAWAAMWFERDGVRVIHDQPLVVVEGAGFDSLTRGPAHYRDTAELGADGNVGIAGHRTTYGAPFYAIDQLQAGDEIHLVDREQTEWTYVVREQAIVAPTDLWVLTADPLELDPDRPLLTLTTCHPRFSAAQRLVVFAELAA